jgi:hypothetical protein
MSRRQDSLTLEIKTHDVEVMNIIITNSPMMAWMTVNGLEWG